MSFIVNIMLGVLVTLLVFLVSSNLNNTFYIIYMIFALAVTGVVVWGNTYKQVTLLDSGIKIINISYECPNCGQYIGNIEQSYCSKCGKDLSYVKENFNR